jgi:hypothetical protein
MKKFLLLLLSLFFVFSCTQKKETLRKQSSGKLNSISVIIDDQLWNGEIGDSLRNKLASSVVGLPQEEPLFTINQYSAKFLEGFKTDTRAIIVVKKARVDSFEFIRNQYAYPQVVFHFSGRSVASILALIQSNAHKMIELIKKGEILECQRINNKSLINPRIINNKFQISLKVPQGYAYVLHKNKFIWLKKEVLGGNTSLLLYQVPLNTLKKKNELVSSIVRMRDSIGNLYIRGTEPNTPMITEDAYAPYVFKIALDGNETYETKGTWELKNDFMGGPFINYAIIDKDYNRVLILEGFCYSPSKEKRDLMHELESIIKSVSIIKRKNLVRLSNNTL